ncbi:MAG: hypothetical protein GX811_04305, partial [Lentisphaerae bacterium]|nr:hypothetical protein [Lentisphaerota bacterium]
LHMAWGKQDDDSDAFFNLVIACGELDMLLVDVWPFDGNTFGGKRTVKASRQSSLEKAAGDLLAERYYAEPGFAGLWSEETYPWASFDMEEFEGWHKAEYPGVDPRTKFGYTDHESFSTFYNNKIDVAPELAECRADKILRFWRESQEWMHGLRKSCALTFSISHRCIAVHAGMSAWTGDTLHVHGPEIYQSFGRDNAYLMECYKDGKARPIMCEFYNWYTPSRAHAIRGFAQHLMHGESFYNFHLAHIFKYPGTGYNWTWDADRWEDVRHIFRKAAKISEYIAVPASGANVAQLCSERTSSQYQDQSPPGFRWYQHQAALWTALQQAQIPADVIWTESLSPEKIARYKVIVTADSKLMNEKQVEILRDWVKQGGVLIAGGTVSLFDTPEKIRPNYMLSDVFGVRYAGFVAPSDPANNDTLVFRRGELPLLIEPTMNRPDVQLHVHRDIKPVKSIGYYTVKDNAALPGLEVGAKAEYDMPLGYDKVELAGDTRVLATFDNGDPAITLAKYGAGYSYFWTPNYPALCYLGSEFENDANRKDFWPNIRESLASMVHGGLAASGSSLPVDVTNVSKEVEVTVRVQPEFNRMMVHLLDYDTGSVSVKGAVLSFNLPEGKKVGRMYYPDTDTELVVKVDGSVATADLREFEVHDMVVISFE